MKFLTDLISGIFNFFGSLFKPKKKGFFLEYEGDAAPAEASADAESQGAESPAAPVAAVAAVAAGSEAPTEALVAASAPTTTKTKTKKSVRGANKKEAAPVAAAVSTPAPAAVTAAAPASSKIFYADIAMNPASGPAVSRRRPGANMAGFLAMAGQVSTR